jgi:CheY-like chemotaxis protein
MKSSPARIAVIEDDSRLRPILVGILSGAGYHPEVFASGDESWLPRVLSRLTSWSPIFRWRARPDWTS